MNDFFVSQEEIQELNEYSQLPDKLRLRCEEVSGVMKEDIFGVRDRLEVIKHVFKDINLGKIADLGGNSGFFSLSLVDLGMAKSATVYDLSKPVLDAGEKMSSALNMKDKVVFKQQAITLEFLRSMCKVDTIICLNLIHHAGVLFDIDIVKSMGWEEYARQWLLTLREKAKILIIGVGFKGKKPTNWKIPFHRRPAKFFKLAKESGWSVIYDANVSDIRRYGTAKANGMQVRCPQKLFLMHSLRRFMTKIRRKRNIDKTHKYHIYLMEKLGD
jgi:hypothetical protein